MHLSLARRKLHLLQAVLFPLRGLRMNLESPRINQCVRDRIEVRGWAFSLVGKPVTAELFIDGERVQAIQLNRLRPDVAGIFGDRAKVGHMGFHTYVPWKEVGNGKPSLDLSIAFRADGRTFRFGPVRILKTDRAMEPRQRGSYKPIWTEQGASEVAAKFAVAGTTDADQLAKSGKSTANTLRKKLDISQDDVVLEIGCGFGRIGEYLAPQCKRWIGTDISPSMIQHASHKLAPLGNVELVELQASSLNDFPDDCVDKVYCSTVFMHLDEWDRFHYVREALRVLRPGGRCYFDNINLAGDQGWSVFSEMAQLDPAARPANISKTSTAEELGIYLDRAGFKDVQTFPGTLYVATTGTKPAA
jgi:SAM-dependent methyltransferase